MLGNRLENRPSTPLERDPLQVGSFVFRTRSQLGESKYGLWTAIGEMPFIQGPFDKAEFLGWLATTTQDVGTRIVYIAKDGELVEGSERAALVSEAAEIAADHQSG